MSEVVKGKRTKSRIEEQHLAIQIRLCIKNELTPHQQSKKYECAVL